MRRRIRAPHERGSAALSRMSISVVIASQDSAATVAECLTSLERQRTNSEAEIIVVDNSSDGSAHIIERQFPSVDLVKVAGPCLIPELWAQGAARATGRVIAFITAHGIPDREWLSEIARRHESGYAGIGGAIENKRPSSVTQWAIYFTRFAPFMLPFSSHPVGQIPGDNAAYKRFVLEECADLIKKGFWDTDVNNWLRMRGHGLLLTPGMIVHHARSCGVWAFFRQRVQHGRIFGATRIRGAAPLWHLAYLTFTPLIPMVLLAKIVRRVLTKGRNRVEFFVSFPLVALFAFAWSWGEFLGYLSGTVRLLGPARDVASGNASGDH